LCGPQELSFGNFDFPGHPIDNYRDLAVVYMKSVEGTFVSYIRNHAIAPPGTPAFSEEQCQGLGNHTAGIGIAVADWDSDGKDDVAVAGVALIAPQLPRLGMMWNNSGGAFTPQLIPVSGAGNVGHGYDLARGYFGGLGRAPVHPFDLAMSNDDGFALRTHVFKDSSGETVNYHDSSNSVRSYGIATAPLDSGNSLFDLVTSDADNDQLRWLYGDGTGDFTLHQQFFTLPNNASPRAVAIGKLNGDNWQDVVVVNHGDFGGFAGNVSVFINQNGNFNNLFGATRYDFTVGTGDRGPIQVVLADMDGDTHLDIVVTNSRAASITVLLNTQ
jgi:hypothetical protein